MLLVSTGGNFIHDDGDGVATVNSARSVDRDTVEENEASIMTKNWLHELEYYHVNDELKKESISEGAQIKCLLVNNIRFII